jgi:hypothetical protein
MYREFRPDNKLRPFVECGWLRSGSSARSIRVMPDGCVDVFVTAEGVVTIAGPANTFFDMPAGNHDVLAGLRLRPGAAATIIGCPASEFTNLRSVFSICWIWFTHPVVGTAGRGWRHRPDMPTSRT